MVTTWQLALGIGVGLLGAFFAARVFRALRRAQARKYQPDRATKFRCSDGHVVRSKGEALVDEFFARRGIAHVYEQTIRVKGHPVKYDWYLPDHDVYVEYWGYHGKAYFQRKREKLRLYRRGHLALLSIEDKDLEDVARGLPAKLAELGVPLPDSPRPTGFCPHCGHALDDRFRA